VIRKTLNPYWNESFDMYGAQIRLWEKERLTCNRRASEESILAIQIFDQKKFKKKDQGFLGVINVRIGSVMDLDVGGDGDCSLCNHAILTGTDIDFLRNAYTGP